MSLLRRSEHYTEADSGQVLWQVIGCIIDLSQSELPGLEAATSPENREEDTPGPDNIRIMHDKIYISHY